MREMRQMWTGGCNKCGLDGVQQMQVECATNATTPGCNKCDNGCNECGQGGATNAATNATTTATGATDADGNECPKTGVRDLCLGDAACG